MTTTKIAIGLRLPGDILRAAKAAAKAEDRSMTNWITWAIRKELDIGYSTCTECGAGWMVNGVCTECEGTGGGE